MSAIKETYDREWSIASIACTELGHFPINNIMEHRRIVAKRYLKTRDENLKKQMLDQIEHCNSLIKKYLNIW